MVATIKKLKFFPRATSAESELTFRKIKRNYETTILLENNFYIITTDICGIKPETFQNYNL